MKLTNPTDEELNAAFATEVAGWTKIPPCPAAGYFCDMFYLGESAQPAPPHYASSVDLVLPWLEKREEAGFHYLKGQWYVHLYAEDKSCANSQGLALAATIALLRAHGIEVEFKS